MKTRGAWRWTALAAAVGMFFIPAQGRWVSLTELPTGAHLSSVQFQDSLKGWIAGDAGFAAKTTDGGTTWSQTATRTGLNLSTVHFVDAQTGWLFGDSGTILKTVNGGGTWTQQWGNTPGSIRKAHVLNGNEAWALDPHCRVLRTSNGQDWSLQLDTGVALTKGKSCERGDIHFATSQIGYIVGWNGFAAKTTNGGALWTPMDAPLFEGEDLYTMDCLDASRCWIAGYSGVFFHTTNGGTSWSEVNTSSSVDFTDIRFTSGDVGYAVSAATYNGGYIYKTTNGGVSWTQRNSLSAPSLPQTYLEGLSALSVVGSRVWTVGQSGAIFRSVDAGVNWTRLNKSQGISSATTLFFSGPDTGWVAGGYGTFHKTTDGGANWTSKPGPGLSHSALFFTDSKTGYATSEGFESSTVFKTTNGGDSWTTALSPEGILTAVHFPTAATGYAAGSGGRVYRTTDAGATWAARNIATLWPVNAIRFTDAETGYAVADSSVYKTTNGGGAWTRTLLPALPGQPFASYTLTALSFADANTGWIAGEGVIYKTSNAGAGWQIQRREPAENYASVFFATPLAGWAVGRWGLLLHTVDGGSTWTRQPTPTDGSVDFTDLHFVSGSTGWVLGSDGTILKTTAGGNPASLRPARWALTSRDVLLRANGDLVFDLARGSAVRIALFDLRGQRIAGPRVLLLKPGSHTLPFPFETSGPGHYLLNVRTESTQQTFRLEQK